MSINLKPSLSVKLLLVSSIFAACLVVADVHEPSCELVDCNHGASCKVIDGQAKCVCNGACSRILAPVCASNGVTYNNLCLMKFAACEQRKSITKIHDGSCEEQDLDCDD